MCSVSGQMMQKARANGTDDMGEKFRGMRCQAGVGETSEPIFIFFLNHITSVEGMTINQRALVPVAGVTGSAAKPPAGPAIKRRGS